MTFLRKLRQLLVERQDQLTAAIDLPRRKLEETLVAEILPLAEACRFLEKTAASLLKPRRLPATGQPLWMPGASLTEVRQPRGVVLVVGPSNYPLLLPGVQIVQALVAGNAVLLKPGRLAGRISRLLAELLVEAGVPPCLVEVTSESHEEVATAIRQRPDYVVLTGSTAAGKIVAGLAAEQLIPCALELSGCDAMYLLPDADLALAAKCLAFGLVLNGGATCMAPRRIFCPANLTTTFLEHFRIALQERGTVCAVDPLNAKNAIPQIEAAIKAGAHLLTGNWRDPAAWEPVLLGDVPAGDAMLAADLFVPAASLIPYETIDELIATDAACLSALAASIFGGSALANQLAARLAAGCVVINDLIAPTADPRVSFGGARSSGYGRTRGAAGLLEMTTLQVVIEPRWNWRPHLAAQTPVELLEGLSKWCHGSGKLAREGLGQLLGAMFTARKPPEKPPATE